MGFTLKKLGQQISNVVGGVEHGVGQAVHDVTHNPVTNTVGNVEKAAIHTVAQAPQYFNPVGQFQGAGQVLGVTTPHIPTFSSSSPLRFANNALINPAKTTGFHINQLAQGHNPYHGSFGQQIGQAGQDALTLASALPIGRGAELATKTAPLLSRVAQGAKFGIKAGGGFGAAQGTSTALQNKENLPQALKTVGINTLTGVGLGLAGGVAAPVLGSGAKVSFKAAKATPEVVNKSLTPRTTLNDQHTLVDYSNHLTGVKPLKPQELSSTISKVRDIAQNHGKLAQVVQGSQLDRLNGVNDLLDTVVQRGKTQSSLGAVAPLGGDARNAGQPKVSMKQPPDFLQVSREYAASHPPAQSDVTARAELSPKDQMALAESNKPLAPSTVNTTKNPFKASLPTVGHDDFGQIIANEQVASEIGKDNVLRSMEQLKKSSPEEYKNFWEYANGDPGFKEAPKSPQLQQALEAWRTADNRIHGNSQALGGNTNYLENHGLHPVVFNEDLTSQLINGTDPNKFSGLNNLSRKHPTMASLRAAAERGGFAVGNDPLSEAEHYLSASQHALRRRAIIKAVGEADGANLEKPHTLILGPGEKNRVDISAKAHNELRGLQRSIPFQNKLVKGARTANVATKSTLLSFGQFHPNNISLMRAAPTLAVPKPSTAFYRNAEGKMKFDPTMSAHPIRAAKGLYATYRPLVPGSGTEFAAGVNARAVKDGMDLKAARIGAPYNAQLYDASGSSIAGVGHKLLGRQMLGMHDQAVRAMVGDLEKRGVSLDSAEARTAGRAINNMMGSVNNEAQKIPPVVSRSLGDWLLARQFTHSKFSQLRTAVNEDGLGGAYARANVAANVAASTAVIVGAGYLLKQKSDSIRDSLIRALTDPAIATPLKDSKGNSVKLRIPGTDASDVAKLLGIKPVRQADGHLGLSWKPSNLPSTVEDFARARLSPLASIPVKLATNENYAGKPLYDPQAPLGTKAEQAATTILGGMLPIGLQGVPMVKAVEKHLPSNVQDVLNANKPGGNSLVKSLGSSFGVTPTTDTTTGKGLETSRYFGAANDILSQAKGNSEKTALQNYLGSKKNPVTGKYDTMPNSNDSQRKAKDLLDAPHTIDLLIQMNQKLRQQGSKTDPLWNLPKDQITAILQYQTYPYGGPDKAHWYNANQDWYEPIKDQRTAFFDSLPKGDPNKPQQPIEFPSASKDVEAKMKTLKGITDSTEYGKFISENPDVQEQFDKAAEYNNKMRVATMGPGAELDTYPHASPEVQGLMKTYNTLPKNDGPKGGNKTRSLWIKSHPNEWKTLTQAWTSGSLYGLEKDASQAEFKDTGLSPKGLGDIYNLGKNSIKQGKDKAGKNTYALTTGQSGGATYTDANGNVFADLGGASGSGGGSGSSYYKKPYLPLPYDRALSLNAGGKIAKPKVSVKLATAYKSSRGKVGKPKVTLKKSTA